ncbi:MAG: ABC transporter substrate-binding protein [Devosia sp.]|nr:ABC transporter substrate-binding protein [Devosia sp.]
MGGDLVVAQSSNPPSLDAMTSSSGASRNITMNVYETLYGFNEKIVPMPILAETVEISDDGLKYRFPLRKGVLFHNGKEMTARDVKASLERYRKVGATGSLLEPVESIDITGDYEVTLTMKRPTPAFLEAFCSPRAPAVIIPEEDGEAEVNKTSLVGTGPYKIVEFVPDSHVRLEKFADYSQDTRFDGRDGFGGKKTAYLDSATFRIIPEPGAAVAALQTGEIQILDQIPVPAARRLEDNPDIDLYENLQWAFNVFILNTNAPPTDNPKFREAVQVALNMEEIMGISTEGLFNLNPGWVYPGTTYDVGDLASAGYYNQADTARAQALLKEAGYNNEEFTILTDSNIPEHGRSAVVIAEQLKAAGINAVINQVDWPTALKLRMEDTGWNGWTLQMGIEPYLGPVAIMSTLTGKRPHFVKNDEQLEALYQELITGQTSEERKATFAKMQTRLYETFSIIKIGDSGLMQASRSNVKNFKSFRFPRVYDIWLEN